MSLARGHPRRFERITALTSRWTTALAAALAAACLTGASATAGTPCGPSGYAYAGVQSLRNGHGISARLTALATPAVESGHVAGWVGLGAPGEGPGGTDEWIQVGLNGLPGSGNTLYYEVTRPHAGTRYVEVARDVPTGRELKIAVLEVAGARDRWRVWVDGRAVSPAIELAGSHGRLTPMAMGESWDGGRPSCNRFAYRYNDVSLATTPGGAWKPVGDTSVIQDPGYRVVRRTTTSFDASATRALPQEPAAVPARPAAASVAAPAPAQSLRPQIVRAQPVQIVPVNGAATKTRPSGPKRKGMLPLPASTSVQPIATTAVAAVATGPDLFLTDDVPVVALEETDFGTFLRLLTLLGSATVATSP